MPQDVRMDITYIERATGQQQKEKIYGRKFLTLLYGDGALKGLFSVFLLPLLTRISFFSALVGFVQKRKRSAAKIAPFIAAYGIDSSEFAETRFQSFNDFFIRKLKSERRPVVSDPNQLALPADGRYLVYPRFDRFFVKGQEFDLRRFLQDTSLAERYAEGSMAIARLCPTDYHRFHFPCEGIPSKPRLINGFLYSVNPMALRKKIAILAENKRMITELETERFGKILYVEIGATCVGSIHQTFTTGQPVRKGDEKGYFEFGGSCIVILFEKDRIEFDSDLVAHSKQGLETRANFGDSLGRAR
jgi:phosphatidylserine decarboxylase